MGAFPQAEITDEAFSITLTDEFPIWQSVSILRGSRQNPQGRYRGYEFAKQRWDEIAAKYPEQILVGAPGSAAGICDEEGRRDVEAFFSGRSTELPGGPRILAQVLETIDLCVAYRSVQKPSLDEFLRQYGRKQN